uniref:Ribosome production factor 2 homolog n=1 Tax=Lygus hesperus TaxID=30085 RepID=A0A0A9YU48_LYGHE
MGIQRVKQPITHKGKKVLQEREPKLIENTKQSIFFNGRSTSETLRKCMKDLFQLKKPDALPLKGKHDILPMEDSSPIETSAKKFDSSLFFFGSHTKKRPNNIIIGRLYDHQILDLVEFGVENFKSLDDFPGDKIPIGTKPCLLFSGPQFELDPTLKRTKNLLVDAFQRETVSSVRLQGLEHVIMFTTHENKIFMRSYRVLLKKSGTRTPRVELVEIGPSMDLSLRRTKLASDDLFKLACKRPKELKAKKVKNISKDVFGSKLGRVHIKQQDIKRLQTRKMKGLKKTRQEKLRHKNQPRKS